MRLKESVVSIAAGGKHSCAVTASGKAYCWGDGSGGVPQVVAGASGLTAVATGKTFACGLATTGAAICWGDNSQGQLGDGSIAVTVSQPSSAKVPSAVNG